MFAYLFLSTAYAGTRIKTYGVLMFGFLTGGGIASIAPQDAVEAAGKGEIILLDVRDLSEVRATGKAKGALHIPMMLLQSKADPRHPECDPKLATDKTIAIYCASGARSGAAGKMLSQMGYEDVRNLGGLHGWARAGGAIERG